MIFFLFKCPNGIIISPTRNEKSLSNSIEVLRSCYGDKQGKEYKVWVDQVLPKQVDSHLWLVKFKKWELYGKAASILKLFVSPSIIHELQEETTAKFIF